MRKLPELDMPQLRRLVVAKNRLGRIALDRVPSLEHVDVAENPLEELSLTGTPNLKEVFVDRLRTPAPEIRIAMHHPDTFRMVRQYYERWL